MKNFVVDGRMEFESVGECAEYIAENGITEDDYDDMLDECYEIVSVCGYEYSPSVALFKLDEVAYKCGFNEYVDSRQKDIEYELDRMEYEEELNFYGYEVVCIESYPSFKVKCIKSNDSDYFTVGKVYEVINGSLLDNDNNIDSPYDDDIRSFDDIKNMDTDFDFEIVEE